MQSVWAVLEICSSPFIVAQTFKLLSENPLLLDKSQFDMFPIIYSMLNNLILPVGELSGASMTRVQNPLEALCDQGQAKSRAGINPILRV